MGQCGQTIQGRHSIFCISFSRTTYRRLVEVVGFSEATAPRLARRRVQEFVEEVGEWPGQGTLADGMEKLAVFTEGEPRETERGGLRTRRLLTVSCESREQWVGEGGGASRVCCRSHKRRPACTARPLNDNCWKPSCAISFPASHTPIPSSLC